LVGVGKYTSDMAIWLSGRGHDIQVITAPPYYPYWRVEGNYRKWFWSVEELGGVKIWRCPIWVPKSPNGLKRIIHLMSFAISSLPIFLGRIFWKPDIILTIEPPLFIAPAALLTGYLSGANCVLHIQDYEVDAAFEMGFINGEWLKRLIFGFENLLLVRFDMISTISNKMIYRALSKSEKIKKTFLFRNWIDADSTNNNKKISGIEYRKKLKIPADAIVALYSGNMGEKQGLEIMAAAAKYFSHGSQSPQFPYFVFCGYGAGLSKLMELCAGLENVLFLDFQPAEYLSDFLSMADIHLLPQKKDAADLVMPSKLGGMLASGRPVLACANIGTEIANMVEGHGLVVAPENLFEFCNGLTSLVVDSDLRALLGTKGREFAVKNLDRDSILSGFESKLIELNGLSAIQKI
jgi:colanic acid biosynthesis glycosyl transferase WcaI